MSFCNWFRAEMSHLKSWINRIQRAPISYTAQLSALWSPNREERPISSRQQSFIEWSQFLTGRETLHPVIGCRCLVALEEDDPSFASRFEAMERLKEVVLPQQVDGCSGFISQFPEHRETAIKIISAWYLGYVGDMATHASEDEASFITYESALMFEPTADATVIPSYAGGATNFWSNPPSD